MNFISDDVRMYKQALETVPDPSHLRDAYNALWDTSNLWNKMVLVYIDSRAESRAEKRKQRARAVKGLQEARVRMAKALMGGEESTSSGAIAYKYVVIPGEVVTVGNTEYHNTSGRVCELVINTNGGVTWEEV